MKKLLTALAVAAAVPGIAAATPFTTTSPTGGALPTGVTEIGGLVFDLRGINGARVVSQLAASSLYVGYAGGNPQVIGTQNGFDPSVVAALGGGLASASVRVTLYDGDSAPGDFDQGTDNSFLVNGVDFGFFGAVASEQTSNDGLTLLSTGTGFGDEILSTGFFTLTDVTGLADLYASLSSGTVTYSLSDVDAGDNFYDFTRGVDGGLIDVGSPPTVTPVPEPATWGMMILGFGAIGTALRRRARGLFAAA